jgi:hypothetical protein
MKRRILKVPLLCLLLVSALSITAQTPNAGKSPLVAIRDGPAPMRVDLHLPDEWSRVVSRNCQELKLIRFAGQAFTVDWGDGKTFPDESKEDSSCGLSHIYGVPGTYKIQAHIDSFTDCCSPPYTHELWKDSATVVVGGNRRVLSFEFLTPVGGELLTYKTLPEVKFNLVLDRKSDLIFDFISEAGTVLGTSLLHDVSYVGESKALIKATDSKVFDDLLRQGKTKVFVRVRILRDGRAVMTKDSPSVIITNRSPEKSLVLDYPSEDARRTVNAHFVYSNAEEECLSYSLDWGDGSPLLQVFRTKTQSECNRYNSKKEKVLSHNYATSGEFTIRFKNDSAGPQRLPEQMGPVEIQTIVVR